MNIPGSFLNTQRGAFLLRNGHFTLVQLFLDGNYLHRCWGRAALPLADITTGSVTLLFLVTGAFRCSSEFDSVPSRARLVLDAASVTLLCVKAQT